jgi:hypothetical protein
MEKKLTNSGPLRKSADKHSIYPLYRDHTALALEAGLGLPRDRSEAQMAEKSDGEQLPAPRRQPRFVHW